MGSYLTIKWWEQEGIEFKRAREAMETRDIEKAEEMRGTADMPGGQV